MKLLGKLGTWEWDLLPWTVKWNALQLKDGICYPPFAEDFLVEHLYLGNL